MKSNIINPLLLSLAIIITNPLAFLSSNLTANISKAVALTTKLPYRFRTPPNNGAPGTATAGGSRDDCKVKDPILQAITPIAEDKTIGGLTTSPQPQFWFSTTLNTDCASLEFVLKSDRGLTLYRGPVAMPSNDKPFSVQLPSTIALRTGQNYRWALLAKQTKNPPIVVNGWVQRVEVPEPTGESLLKAKLYAEQGIWHESASIVQDILCKDPTEPAALAFWNAIVTDAGIRDLTKPEPLQP
jgi:Domain of Unknown Function (DUF928)